jgi:hypothetical protein
VGEEHEVDAGDLAGEGKGGVLVRHFAGRRAAIGEVLIDSKVDGGDDHVDPLLVAEHLDPALGGGDGIDEGKSRRSGRGFPMTGWRGW